MSTRIPKRPAAFCALGVTLAVGATGCGAGAKTAAKSATSVTCGFSAPKQSTTVNVLAYNSSAIDPFTNTMVKSCSHDGVTLKHDPIDFGGQVQKTVATLSGSKGSYDIIETYGFVIPEYASTKKLMPLDGLFKKYAAKYKLNAINKNMRTAMTYDGKLYGLPMQAQVFVMAYRKDIFKKLGLTPPTTFAELRTDAAKIQKSGGVKYPIALPLLASNDITYSYQSALNSLGAHYVDPKTKKPNFDTPQGRKAFKALMSLKPYMSPDVTTFDQPKVQQQMYNGSAAIAIMYSGRMSDLTQKSNTKYADKFGFAAPPTVAGGKYEYNNLSVDGWSIPTNTSLSKDMLFQMISSAVSEKASKSALPAAYPARDGVVTDSSMPYAAAANNAIKHALPADTHTYVSKISNDTRAVVGSVFLGKTSIAAGVKKMQQIAEKDVAASQ